MNKLKFKIFLTNISRIITSFIFVNLNFSFFNKVFGISLQNNQIIEPSCYAQTLEPDRNIFEFKNVLIIFVPAAIIIGIITIIIKKKKSKKEEKNVKKD